MLKKILLLSCTVVLTGCVNQFAEFPDPATSTDPVTFTDDYFAAAQSGLISPFNIIPIWISNEAEHREFSRWACVKEQYRDGYYYQIRQVCHNMGGKLEGEWCRSRDRKIPYFRVRIYKHFDEPMCTLDKPLQVKLIAPLESQSADNANWMNYAQSEGFIAGSKHSLQEEQQIVAQNAQRARLLARQAEADRRMAAHIKYDVPEMLKNGKGRKVCKRSEQAGAMYVGYIEDAANSRIKVLLVNHGGPGWTLGGFRQGYIWDDPVNWYFCN